MSKTITLLSNDSQTVFGTAVLDDTVPGSPPNEDLSFPGTPEVVIWKGRAFRSSPRFGDGPENYAETDVKLLADDAVKP